MRWQWDKSPVEISVRIWLSIALQIVLLLAVLPELAMWRGIEREVWSEFAAASVSAIAIVVLFPIVRKCSPVTRVLVVLLSVIPVLVLLSVLMEHLSSP